MTAINESVRSDGLCISQRIGVWVCHIASINLFKIMYGCMAATLLSHMDEFDFAYSPSNRGLHRLTLMRRNLTIGRD